MLTDEDRRYKLLKRSKHTNKVIYTPVFMKSHFKDFQGFCHHLGGDAVAAKITADVWEIVQLSNLVTPVIQRSLTKIVSFTE